MAEDMTTIDQSRMAPILQRYQGRGRDALLPLLHEVQLEYGWLPEEAQRAVGETLRVPLADIHGVVEFYTLLYNKPTARKVVRICQDPSCHLAGSTKIMAALETQLNLKEGQTSADCEITYEHVPCIGLCEWGPAALIGDRSAGNLSADRLSDFLSESYPEPHARVYGEPLWLLTRLGRVDPSSLTDYERHGGYQGLRKALSMSPESIIELFEESGILGRGGAQFPFGRKQSFTRNAEAPSGCRHIVVNGDESEPGTFKDRCLMEEDPFSIVEAATLAAYAVGAQQGWIFVRGEYPRAYARLSNAIKMARKAGYLGRDVMGHVGFDFDIELRRGAGAYICGEETALFSAIEGKRGFPRLKPPFPVTRGLFQEPTAINNVETLVAGLAVLNVGLEAWCAQGTESSPGTKLFCLSGNICNPGIYEVPFGVTISQLIEMAGGVPNGKAVQAVLVGGAAGVFVDTSNLDIRLTYEDARANGIPLGSGVLVIFDETADLSETLYQLGRFFAHESCGKCFPCQLGTKRQVEILKRIAKEGKTKTSDKRDLLDIGFTMTTTSLCGLGQTAASALLSAIELWPEIVE